MTGAKKMTTEKPPQNVILVERPHGPCWKHVSKDEWIVFYAHLESQGKPAFLSYRATESTGGRAPWTVNNRRSGAFYDLESAAASLGA